MNSSNSCVKLTALSSHDCAVRLAARQAHSRTAWSPAWTSSRVALAKPCAATVPAAEGFLFGVLRYSALKKDGQRLSVLLKKGHKVEAKPARPVTVYNLSVQDFSPPLFTLGSPHFALLGF